MEIRRCVDDYFARCWHRQWRGKWSERGIRCHYFLSYYQRAGAVIEQHANGWRGAFGVNHHITHDAFAASIKYHHVAACGGDFNQCG